MAFRITVAALLALFLVGCNAGNDTTLREDAAPADFHSDMLVIERTTLVNGHSGSQTNVTLVIEGGRITHVGARPDMLPTDARVIDGADRFVIPGLIDVHVHDSSDDYLLRMLAWGVTSVHLMPQSLPESSVRIQARSQTAEAPMPRLQVTPMFAWAFPDNLVPDTYEFLKPGTPEEAREAVRKLHSEGYRQIKIIQDDSSLWAGDEHRSPLGPEPVLEALINEARANDMRIYVHATQLDVARTAIASGIDAFMHGIMDKQLTSEDWRAMHETGTAWTPTLNALLLFGDQRRYARRLLADSDFAAVMGTEQLAGLKANASADQPIIPPKMDMLVEHTDAYLTTIAQNSQRALQFDVPIAVGSDGGPSGLSTQLEMELLQENGMSPTAVLAAATYGGAVTLGWENEVGSVEVGKLADLVILDADPTVDIRNCRKIDWVIKGGNPYTPEALFAEGF